MGIRCNFCNEQCIKNGFQANGNQHYTCCVCKRRQQSSYRYNVYKWNLNKEIIQFTREGLGIRSTAGVLRISTTTLLKRIISISRNIHQAIISKGKVYEVDEMCTYAIGFKSKRAYKMNCTLFKNLTIRNMNP